MVQIIAEAGVNHNGNIIIAKKLVDVAADAGADWVKFQTFKANNLLTKSTPKAEYQEKNSNIKESHFDMIKRLELSHSMHLELIDHCNKKNIKFLSTAFDIETLQYLSSLGISTIKIPSGEITNLPYLRHVSALKSDVILSTGMSTMSEIERALYILEEKGTKRSQITVLHCSTEYPTPIPNTNLLAMVNIQNALGVKVGYSDHTIGLEVPVAVVALGATIIEKHFTLDRKMPGPDHISSLNPNELKEMVRKIKDIKKAMGDGIKRPTFEELKNKKIVRKSIVAAKAISAGNLFNENNLAVKRPGTGLSPMRWDEVIGRVANRNFFKDELIEL